MSTIRRWFARFLGIFAGARRERELAEELETHLQMQIDENVRRGMSTDEARRSACVKAGGIAAARDAYRDQRGVPFVADLRQDVRFAGRLIRRNPAIAAIIVVSLALGIGANTAVFSLTDAVFFKALPVADPEELVLFEWTGPVRTRGYAGSQRRGPRPGQVIGASFSMPFFEQVRAAGAGLSGVFAFAPLEQLNMIAGGDARIARGQVVTGDYHATLGVRPALGRTIVPDDDRRGADPVAVLTHRYWQRRFGGDSSIVGTRITINGFSTTVIGVTPSGFVGTLDVGSPADVTLPMSFVDLIRPGDGDLTNANFWWVQIMGRRRAGVTAQRAEEQLNALFQSSAFDPGSWSRATSPAASGRRVAGSAGGETAARDTVAVPARPHLALVPGAHGPNDERRDYRRPLLVLTLAAGLVLIIACTNAAILLLTRGTVREKEITVRVALGASRSRIVRQLLVEGVLLVMAAGALGSGLAVWGRSLLLTLRPDTANLEVPFDLRVLAVAILLSAVTALMFGLVPALRAARVDVAAELKSSSRTIRRGARSFLTRSLIVAQIAMSVVLLVSAALLLGTLRRLDDVNVGFDAERLLLFRVDPRLSGYDGARVVALYRELHDRLATLPGVAGVTSSRHPQLSGGSRSNTVSVLGQDERNAHRVLVNPVGRDYFQTMRLPVISGRPFRPEDDERVGLVAIVSEKLAQQLFPGENPVGRRLRFNGAEPEIVGVAADAKYYSVRQEIEPVLYIAFLQTERGQASFALRTEGDPLAIVPLVRQAVREVDPNLPLFEIRTQRDAIHATLGAERLLARLATAFGVLALALACVGIYALASYATAQRTGEIGIRLALGAPASSILWLVTRGMVVLIAIGAAIGLVTAVAASRTFAELLYGLTPTDPLTLVAVVAVVAAVALVAVLAPANRAKRVSPLVAIRHGD